MPLTEEERNALFETLTGENLEDRAEAILQLRTELDEVTQSQIETETAFSELQNKYTQSQNTMKNLLNSLPQGTESSKSEDKKEKETKTFGFAKFKQ